MRPFSFDTSAGAVFRLNEVRASSVNLAWEAGEVTESDGVAEFMVTRAKDSTGGEADATAWLPNTTESLTTVSGLKPGTGYVFKLYLQGLDGSRVF